MEKKVFTLMLTTGQFKSLREQVSGTDGWWERLSDITEFAPAWLKENVGPVVAGREISFKEFKQMVPGEYVFDTTKNWLIMVHPVPQSDSGVLTRVEIPQAEVPQATV